jgi:hypothetical protein
LVEKLKFCSITLEARSFAGNAQVCVRGTGATSRTSQVCAVLIGSSLSSEEVNAELGADAALLRKLKKRMSNDETITHIFRPNLLRENA